MLDEDVQSFLEKTLTFYPEGLSTDNFKLQRHYYNILCQAFAEPYPDGITSKNFKIDSDEYRLNLRQYQKDGGNSETAIVYFHGGGYITGDLESHDSICADICDATAMDLIAVDYRLAPKYQFPDDVNDAVAAFQYASENFSKVIVAGDSAGGNLAAAVCVATRNDTLKPTGQVLIYAALGGNEFDLESYKQWADTPMLTTNGTKSYKAHRAGTNPVPKDPLFYPLLLDDFSNLPPCHAISADIDPIRDDSREYVLKLQQAGVYAKWINATGLLHGFLRARYCTKKGKNSFNNICESFLHLQSQPE